MKEGATEQREDKEVGEGKIVFYLKCGKAIDGRTQRARKGTSLGQLRGKPDSVQTHMRSQVWCRRLMGSHAMMGTFSAKMLGPKRIREEVKIPEL